MTSTSLGQRVLIAPDKFKGTMTAIEAADAIAAGVLAEWPHAVITLMPFADGGEGTVDAVIAAGGQEHTREVTGPLGDPIVARWAMLGTTAVVEMAQSSGLQFVDPSPTTAWTAHTEGTGELIRAALDLNSHRIIIGVGGSATTDGGLGALRVLGAEFFDESGVMLRGGGDVLHRVSRIELMGLDPRLEHVELVLCSDVSNPFVGPNGAAAIFGPQKGANSVTVTALDQGLRIFAMALARATGVDLITAGWGGSGGGLAGGLHAACGAVAGNGVDIIADLLELDVALLSQDLVIVGEGSIDEQSILGKTPIGVARHARDAGVLTVAVVGRNLLEVDSLTSEGIVAISSASDAAPNPGRSLREPTRWTTAATRLLVSRLGESLAVT